VGDAAEAGGRAAAAAASAAAQAPEPGVALSMVPLDNLDLQRMSIIYTTGDMAAVTPVYNYNFHVIAYEAAAGSGGEGWRSLLFWLGVPGLVIAGLMAASVQEPRAEQQAAAANARAAGRAASSTGSESDEAEGAAFSSSGGGSGSSSSGASHGGEQAVGREKRGFGKVQSGAARLLAAARGGGSALGGMLGRGAAAPAPAAAGAAAPAVAIAGAGAGAGALALPAPGTVESHGSALAPVKELLGMRAFQATTLAAALNDLGSYALIAWHSTFYERVFGLDSSVYAPMLAVRPPAGSSQAPCARRGGWTPFKPRRACSPRRPRLKPNDQARADPAKLPPHPTPLPTRSHQSGNSSGGRDCRRRRRRAYRGRALGGRRALLADVRCAGGGAPVTKPAMTHEPGPGGGGF
jgi:hypothetical protein